MNLSWTTGELERAAESAHGNLSALVSWDALSRWFEPGGLRDSVRHFGSPSAAKGFAMLDTGLQEARLECEVLIRR